MTYYPTIDWATEIYLTNLCFILQDLKLNNLQGLVPVRALLCSYKCFNSKGHDYYGVAFPWITRQRDREREVLFFFSVRRLSDLHGHSVFSSPPQRPMTSHFEGFLYQILSLTLFSYLNSWERASFSFFNVECQTRELLVPFL